MTREVLLPALRNHPTPQIESGADLRRMRRADTPPSMRQSAQPVVTAFRGSAVFVAPWTLIQGKPLTVAMAGQGFAIVSRWMFAPNLLRGLWSPFSANGRFRKSSFG
jgi:hypothetical protein